LFKFRCTLCVTGSHILLTKGRRKKKVIFLMAGPLKGGGGVKGRPFRKKIIFVLLIF